LSYSVRTLKFSSSKRTFGESNEAPSGAPRGPRKILDPPLSLLNKPGMGTTGMGAPRALYLGLSVRMG
ncbi:unnamed protein product, partial [Porites evermanni]